MPDNRSDRFAGKSVLVTGASQGIGEGIALAFAEQGARVALNGRKEDKLRAVQEKLPRVSGGDHPIAAGDMSKEDDVDRIMKESLEAFGGLDVLVCNAGIMIPSPSEDVTLEDFNKVLAVNLTSVMLCSRAALKYWRAHDKTGTIIVNSSVHQQIPKPQYLGYSASKGAVGNVVRTLALEYARFGIRVNAVAPGAIVTPMNDAWVHDPKQHEAVSRHIPMRRPGESREIADVVTFLASEDASYITGQTIFVDGGLTLYADFEQNWSS
ncbi:SDR family NAD(P)-dependent oxidoreductase [Tanticharoenia sakaeratensis]|uniref:NAD(P)-dependent glucose 1-dehydrogenase n=1 Tax=Tanticharoenia sakaeratensis NBRC 103193 TaxID=1231623 RepID=A0A0D6MJ59_9PROT|nr:glucose 1-dehydrogenase [Tanticharoenia sakaeratensis]GAN53293.1 NAD(P)-dependent glucose 1-dehydrogenase [Tanticharoenia sakaeratensis NBRC 103193]GBQ21064.1 NAD/NADP-dependent glucose 1-dehydrogenase [Tanticharoenia sakaeratensis NBRC 103193]